GVRVRLCLGHEGTKQATTTARHRPTAIVHPDFIPPGGIASMFDSVETIYPAAARSMRLWVSTRRRHSRSRLPSDFPARALASLRLRRENADSACHRWPNTRLDRLPPTWGRTDGV